MSTLLLVPLDDIVVFPSMSVTLNIEVGDEERVLLVPRHEGEYAKVGTVAEVGETVRLPGGARAVTLTGLHRGIAGAAHTDTQGQLRVEVDERPDEEPPRIKTIELEREYRATVEEILENNRAGGFAVIGTPDDAAARIAELVAASEGGFGAYLFLDHDWAAPTAKRRSYELFAEYVMPRFQGHLEPRAASKDWLTGSAGEFVNRATHAIAKATEDHAAERAARA